MNYIRLFQKNMLKNGIKPSKQEKRTRKIPILFIFELVKEKG